MHRRSAQGTLNPRRRSTLRKIGQQERTVSEEQGEFGNNLLKETEDRLKQRGRTRFLEINAVFKRIFFGKERISR